MTDNELEITIEKSRSAISKAGFSAASAYGSEDQPIRIAQFLECVKSDMTFLVIDFLKRVMRLNISFNYKDDEAVNESNSYVGIAYIAANDALFSDFDKISRFLSNYKTEEGEEGFLKYLFGCFGNIIPKAMNKEKFANRRTVSNLFSAREEKELSSFIKFANRYNGSFSEQTIRSYVDSLPISEKERTSLKSKLNDIINRNANAMGVSVFSNDTDDESAHAIDSYSFHHYEDMEREADRQENIASLIDRLNELYEDSFSDVQKKYFPYAFTNNYIRKTAKEILKDKPYSEIGSHWDEFCCRLNIYEISDGRCSCIQLDLLNKILETKRLMSQTELAHLLGITEKSLSYIYRKCISALQNDSSLQRLL